MTKYEATDSKGRLHKRGTKNRTYTHCVVAHYAEETFIVNGVEHRLEPKVSWAGNPALAEARANTFRNYTPYGDSTRKVFAHVEIIEAREV